MKQNVKWDCQTALTNGMKIISNIMRAIYILILNVRLNENHKQSILYMLNIEMKAALGSWIKKWTSLAKFKWFVMLLTTVVVANRRAISEFMWRLDTSISHLTLTSIQIIIKITYCNYHWTLLTGCLSRHKHFHLIGNIYKCLHKY